MVCWYNGCTHFLFNFGSVIISAVRLYAQYVTHTSLFTYGSAKESMNSLKGQTFQFVSCINALFSLLQIRMVNIGEIVTTAVGKFSPD